MKLILSTTLAMLLTTAAAMAFSLPAHEPDGWRDTGCEEAANVYVKNAAGKVLYMNNPTCPDLGGSGVDEVSDEAPGDGDGDGGEEGPGDGDTGGEGESAGDTPSAPTGPDRPTRRNT